MPLSAAAIAGISAAASTVASAGGSMFTSAGNKRAVRQAAIENRRMYALQRADAVADRDLQRQWALSDWNTQNEYNSPEAQMGRYRDAGLNPNLVYGEGVAASSGQADALRETNTRSSQSGNTPAARYNMDFGFQQFAQNLLLDEQRNLIRSQANKNNAEAGLSDTSSDRLRTLLPYDVQTRQVDMDRVKKDIERIGSEIALNTAELGTKAQYLIESDARVRKMYNDSLLSFLNLQNSINNTGIRRGELSATNADVRTRQYDAETRRAQLDFDKKRQSFDDVLKQRGVAVDQTGSLWKTIGTFIRSAGGILGDIIPGYDGRYDAIEDYKRPKY